MEMDEYAFYFGTLALLTGIYLDLFSTCTSPGRRGSCVVWTRTHKTALCL